MSNPVASAARAAARRLESNAEPGLTVEVETTLATWETKASPPQYTDTVELATLIVSIASLAWTVYNDLRNRTKRPEATVVTQAVRVRLHESGQDAPEHVLDVVIAETIRATEDTSNT